MFDLSEKIGYLSYGFARMRAVKNLMKSSHMNQLFVNDLTVIDFSYFDFQRGIVGESWIVDIVLNGDLDEQGMVFDFGHVKKLIKQLIDHEIDHRFVLSTETKDLLINKVEGELTLSWSGASGNYLHRSPEDAVALLDSRTINKKGVAKYLEGKVLEVVPDNVKGVSITLREEDIDQAFYHYSHGLKKHEGNCQRIVHGHRSRLEIFQNAQRNHDLEDLWAAKFRNIYIATREDLTETAQDQGKAYYRFDYTSSQGQFELRLPAKKVYLIDTDTTVELIAAHIAEECAKMHPDNHFEVRAYEGVGKGAIAVRKQ